MSEVPGGLRSGPTPHRVLTRSSTPVSSGTRIIWVQERVLTPFSPMLSVVLSVAGGIARHLRRLTSAGGGGRLVGKC